MNERNLVVCDREFRYANGLGENISERSELAFRVHTCTGAESVMRILKEPKNAILKQYERLLALDEVKLVFEDDALEWIAERALEKDTGARALRAILEDFMMDIMYEIPKDPNIGSVVITRPYLEKKGGPRIEMRG